MYQEVYVWRGIQLTSEKRSNEKKNGYFSDMYQAVSGKKKIENAYLSVQRVLSYYNNCNGLMTILLFTCLWILCMKWRNKFCIC